MIRKLTKNFSSSTRPMKSSVIPRKEKNMTSMARIGSMQSNLNRQDNHGNDRSILEVRDFQVSLMQVISRIFSLPCLATQGVALGRVKQNSGGKTTRPSCN